MKRWKFPLRGIQNLFCKGYLSAVILTLIGFYGVAIQPLQAEAQVALDPDEIGEGEKLFNEKCANCHPVNGSPVRSFAERKEPNMLALRGVGSKFQPDWLAAWLQNPTRIRPAGTMYLNHIKEGEKFDVVDESTLEPHLSVSAEEAKTLTGYLLNLTNAQIKESGIDPNKKVPRSQLSKGRNLFEQKKACYGCHQVKTRDGRIVGGMSGPVLYNVGDRLRPNFLYAYLRDPQAFDPIVWMPKEVSDQRDAKLLTQYLLTFKEKKK
jgi:cytochrome c2